MKVLLINPPFHRLMGLKNIFFPIGLAYLASYIKKYHDVAIYNSELGDEAILNIITPEKIYENQQLLEEALNNPSHYVWEEIKNKIKIFSPDVVGITTMTCKYSAAQNISSIAKKIDPQIKVVLGGSHATADANNVLMDNKDVDFVIKTEGELAFSKLLQYLEGEIAINQVGNLLFKKNGEIIHNQPEPYIDNLDTIPFPVRNLDLRNHIYKPYHLNGLLGSRGCPWDCTYCSSKDIWTRKIRYRSNENILKEIDHLIDTFKIRSLMFIDDTFTANSKKIIDFCKRLIDNCYNVSWTCTTRLDVLTDEVVKYMKKSGLSTITVGIESGSERILQLTQKGITKEKIYRGVELLNKYGIDWHAFFMVGFPFETREDIQKTKEFIKELKPSTVELSILTPYPGSIIYEQAKKMGVIPNNMEWSKYSHQSSENHFVKNIPKDEFKAITKSFFLEIKKYNNSWRNNIRKLINRREEIIKNPNLFLLSILNVLKRKFLPSNWRY